MNRIIAAAIVCVFAIGSGCIGYFAVMNFTDDIIEAMETDRNETIKSGVSSYERAKNTEKLWDKQQKLLAALLPHDELEEIEIGIMNMPDYAQQHLDEEYIKSLNECINRLKHIQETENPTIKNIF